MKKQVTITVTFTVDSDSHPDMAYACGSDCLADCDCSSRAVSGEIFDVAYDMAAQIETLEKLGFSVSQKNTTTKIL